MSKYYLLMDYGSEGYSFWNEEGYDTVDEVVKEAVSVPHAKFKIVQIVDWEAKEAGK